MKKWISYKPELQNKNFDVIIIGSGMSGLTTAVLLAQNNYKVLVLEKHFKVEYLSVLDANTLKSIADNTTQIAILCSVFLGSTRLIDNIIFNKG